MTTEMDEKMAACMALAGPSTEHELLKAFEGTWKAKVTMWMDPASEPMVSTGTMKNSLTLGGRFIEHDYQDDAGQFSGRGFFGYNRVESRWEGFWIDSWATFMMTERGSYDEATKTWTMHDEMRDPGSGHMMKKRSVVTLRGDGTHTMETWFTPLDGDNAGVESKCMAIEYTRA